jgi:hypothetical protein
MRGTDAKSIWGFLLATFLAVGTAVAILPGCADDSDRGFSDSDTGYDTGVQQLD